MKITKAYNHCQLHQSSKTFTYSLTELRRLLPPASLDEDRLKSDPFQFYPADTGWIKDFAPQVLTPFLLAGRQQKNDFCLSLVCLRRAKRAVNIILAGEKFGKP
jgi:hypothetical protein